jgi:hypothetical protein
MERNNEINLAIDNTLDRDLVLRMASKQQAKTQAQRQKPLAYTLAGLGFVCQLISFTMASFGVLSLVSDSFHTIGLIMVCVAILILVLIEMGVWFSLSGFHAERLDDGRINPSTVIIMVFALSLSTPLTYVGTDYAVQGFASAPELVDIEKIEAKYVALWQADSTLLTQEIEDNYFNAKDVHKKNNWKGITTRSAAATEKGFLTQAQELEKERASVRIALRDSMNVKVSEAEQENKTILAAHKESTTNFGFSFALITVLAMIVLFACRWFVEDWKRRFVKEGLYLATPNETAKTDTDNRTDTKVKHINVSKVEEKTPRTVITAFGTNSKEQKRTCLSCDTDITGKRSDAVFCSAKCRGTHHKNVSKKN